jgi:hypothetical protein
MKPRLAAVSFKKAITGLGPLGQEQGLPANPSQPLANFISSLIGFLTIFGALAFIIWVIIGAYSWITSEGKPEKLEKARNHITQALIGFFILVAAYALVGLVGKILGIEIFKLTVLLNRIKLKSFF